MWKAVTLNELKRLLVNLFAQVTRKAPADAALKKKSHLGMPVHLNFDQS